MFKGSAHIPDGKMDILLEGAGGYSNAFTSSDMTVFYDVAASNFLDTMLWIEADRLAGLTDTIDQKKLDNQRAVVLNERRQSYENRPYGIAPLLLRKTLWPEGHGYHWPVIGYHKDLAAASVSDVKRFFHTWYVPNNAVMVIAGDVDPAKVKAEVTRYFAWIPEKPDPKRPGYQVLGPLKKSTDLTATDKVAVPRVYLAWRGPKSFSKDEPAMDMAARILGGGKSSRLYKTLVYDKQVAQDVSASFDSEMLGGEFDITVTAKPGVDPKVLEQAVTEAVAKLGKRPPTGPELQRAQNLHESQFLQQLQASLWRGIQLAQYDAQAGNPDYLAKDVERYRAVTPADVMRVVKHWLHPKARVQLVISPAKKTPATAPAPRPQTAAAAKKEVTQ